MQKTLQIITVIIVAALLVGVGATVVAADRSLSNLDETLEQEIASSCKSVQATLTRLSASDALARVHLGQEYETISTKLMTPMNSRIVVDRFDGSELIKTAAEFSDHLEMFRSKHLQYSQTLNRLIKLGDCQNQPRTFAGLLEKARTGREEVRAQVDVLSGLTKQYRHQLADLEKLIKSGNIEGQIDGN